MIGPQQQHKAHSKSCKACTPSASYQEVLYIVLTDCTVTVTGCTSILWSNQELGPTHDRERRNKSEVGVGGGGGLQGGGEGGRDRSWGVSVLPRGWIGMHAQAGSFQRQHFVAAKCASLLHDKVQCCRCNR